MKNIVSQIRAGMPKTIVVVGDLMLDEYIIGQVGRVSPEAPVPILKEDCCEWALGGAANVAANCKHVGCDVKLVGVIGAHDSAGVKLLEKLREVGIDQDCIVKSSSRITTCKRRMMAKNHQLLRVDNEVTAPMTEQEYTQVTEHIDSVLTQDSVLIISDYAKGIITARLMKYIFAKTQVLKNIVIIDPKGPDFEKYKGANYLKPNAKEFAHMVSYFNIDTSISLVEQGRAICKSLNLTGLFVTLGENGIHFVSQSNDYFSPAKICEVYDITGAGDTVVAFLALGLAHNFSIEDCLLMANRAASVAISHVKTYAVSLDELIDRHYEPTEKIFYDWTVCKIELDWVRRNGKKVVFTNGCFDILHSGHVHLLKEAKKLGDILVLGINTDDSIKRFKGPSRPINMLADRACVVAALGVIDFVVVFDQDTPKELIEYLKPDVLVKGGDYSIDKIAGASFVKSYGGDVRVIDLVREKSTTCIIKKISEIKV
jgi:D-beta-D-heptose 7-phosphate kinase/D-beta-D-heptose 1-phosphate adenosyltransferase